MDTGTFGAWLRGHALLPDGTAPKRWDGKDVSAKGSAAVFAMDVTSPLQQATETAVRLYGQYLFESGQHGRIAFHFASGFYFPWVRWSNGERIDPNKRTMAWRSVADTDSSAANLAKYLDVQYNFTNIHSLTTQDLMSVDIGSLTPGDVLVNLRGSVAFVADMAVNTAGQRSVLLLSGGTPARQLTILDNPGSQNKPWYDVPADGRGTFRLNDYGYDWSVLMRFRP